MLDGHESKEWECAKCDDDDKRMRNCPLKESDDVEGKNTGFLMALANDEFLEACPVGLIDEWSILKVNESLLCVDLGIMPEAGGMNSQSERDLQSLNIVLTEKNKAEKLRIERDAKRK